MFLKLKKKTKTKNKKKKTRFLYSKHLKTEPYNLYFGIIIFAGQFIESTFVWKSNCYFVLFEQYGGLNLLMEMLDGTS